MTTSGEHAKNEIKEKLHSQTAKIAWVELQKFFAQGRLIEVSPSEDLVDIAAAIALDDTGLIESLISSQKLSFPSNQRAKFWVDQNAILWCLVVSPHVLVQEVKC